MYDPVTNTWAPAGTMGEARYAPTATLLPGGKVLDCAGSGLFGHSKSTTLYDPATNTWTEVGGLAAGATSTRRRCCRMAASW